LLTASHLEGLRF